MRLVDFGLAKENVHRPETGATSMCGTFEYLAPEVVLRAGHGWAVDWWSLGMVLYEMLVGLPPWYTKDHKVLFERIVHAPVRLPPGGVSARAADLIEGLLQKQPLARLGSARGARDVKAHAFFAGTSWDDLAAQRVPPPFAPCAGGAGGGGAGALNFDRRFTSLAVREQMGSSAFDDGEPLSPAPSSAAAARGGDASPAAVRSVAAERRRRRVARLATCAPRTAVHRAPPSVPAGAAAPAPAPPARTNSCRPCSDRRRPPGEAALIRQHHSTLRRTERANPSSAVRRG